jgi:hypothetical protein
MSDFAPPIPDTVFLPAWAIANRKVGRMRKLLHIGDVRLYRELTRRGLEWKQHKKPVPEPSEGRCVVCHSPVEPGLPWGSNGDASKHWTCAEWENGRVLLYDGPLAGIFAAFE